MKFTCLFDKRVGKGIFVSREWSIFVRVKCEMLDFSAVKCDLFSVQPWGVIVDKNAPWNEN
jgi:hypothetical protein